MMVNVCFNNDCFILNICTKSHRGRYCSGTSFLYSDDFTEELLNLHEAKITTLKKCYEDHKDLFEGVTKWQDNWTLYLELDVSAVSKFFVEAFKMLISGHGDMWLYASPFRKRLMTLQDSTTGVGTFWKKRSRELTCRKVCLRWEFLCCFSKYSITVSRCQPVRYSLRRHFKDVILDELANKRRWRKTPLLYCRFCPTDGDIKWLSLSGSGAYVCSSKAFQKLM